MALTAQQLQQIFAGGNMTPGTPNMGSIYGGVLPSMGGGNPALNAYNQAALSPLPAPTMAYAAQPRTSPALNAATAAAGPVNSVSGQRTPSSMGSGGGLLSLLTGQSKNNQPGLAGLLGGPQQGGLLQMLFGGNKKPAQLAKAPAALTRAQRYAAANSGPGSVSAMERWHGSGERGGGPAAGGEYASGGH